MWSHGTFFMRLQCTLIRETGLRFDRFVSALELGVGLTRTPLRWDGIIDESRNSWKSCARRTAIRRFVIFERLQHHPGKGWQVDCRLICLSWGVWTSSYSLCPLKPRHKQDSHMSHIFDPGIRKWYLGLAWQIITWAKPFIPIADKNRLFWKERGVRQ